MDCVGSVIYLTHFIGHTIMDIKLLFLFTVNSTELASNLLVVNADFPTNVKEENSNHQPPR